MNATDKLEQKIRKNKRVIIKTAAIGVVSVVVYTTVCKKFGYRMSKPLSYNDTHIFAVTPSGRILKSEMLDLGRV